MKRSTTMTKKRCPMCRHWRPLFGHAIAAILLLAVQQAYAASRTELEWRNAFRLLAGDVENDFLSSTRELDFDDDRLTANHYRMIEYLNFVGSQLSGNGEFVATPDTLEIIAKLATKRRFKSAIGKKEYYAGNCGDIAAAGMKVQLYRLSRKSPTGNWQIVYVGQNSLYIDTGLESNTTYAYRVEAHYGGNTSRWSDTGPTRSFPTKKMSNTVPEVPDGQGKKVK